MRLWVLIVVLSMSCVLSGEIAQADVSGTHFGGFGGYISPLEKKKSPFDDVSHIIIYIWSVGEAVGPPTVDMVKAGAYSKKIDLNLTVSPDNYGLDSIDQVEYVPVDGLSYSRLIPDIYIEFTNAEGVVVFWYLIDLAADYMIVNGQYVKFNEALLQFTANLFTCYETVWVRALLKPEVVQMGE